jgi:hypothetical protein
MYFVVKRRRNGLLHVNYIVMADAVELVCGDARLDVLTDHLQHFGGETPSNAHLFNFVGGLDSYGHASSLGALGARQKYRKRRF